MKCHPPLTNSLVNNVPPSVPTEECVIFFSCILQISRWVKQKQNHGITLAAAESDTRSDMKLLDLLYVECKVGCVVRLGTACTQNSFLTMSVCGMSPPDKIH